MLIWSRAKTNENRLRGIVLSAALTQLKVEGFYCFNVIIYLLKFCNCCIWILIWKRKGFFLQIPSVFFYCIYIVYERVFLFFSSVFFFLLRYLNACSLVFWTRYWNLFFFALPPATLFSHSNTPTIAIVSVSAFNYCALWPGPSTYHTIPAKYRLYYILYIYACNSGCISSYTIYVRMRIYSLTFFIARIRGGEGREEGSCGSAELALLFFHQIFFIHQVFNLQKCSFIRTNNLYSVWICHVLLFPIVATLFFFGYSFIFVIIYVFHSSVECVFLVSIVSVS